VEEVGKAEEAKALQTEAQEEMRRAAAARAR
jgi:hypothetical protein